MDEDIDAILEKAVRHHEAGRLGRASRLYRRILDREPDNLAALINLGAARRAQGRAEDAKALFVRAAGLDPTHAGIQFNLGNALADLGSLADALAAYEAAAALDSGSAEILNNLGDVLMRLDRPGEAAETFTRAVDLQPGLGDAHNNLGNALRRLGKGEQALAHFRTAAEKLPKRPEVLCNLGTALLDQGAVADGEAWYARALACAPDNAEAHCLLAFSRLAGGDFANGWAGYARRWASGRQEAPRPFPQPRWLGPDDPVERLLVWGEQGVGDELMFATLLAELSGHAREIIVECEHRLVPLLARSFRDFRVHARRDPPDADLLDGRIGAQISFGDLGRHLRPDVASFAVNPPALLKADAQLTQQLRARYREQAGDALRVGVSWRSKNKAVGEAKTVALETWHPILATAGCCFFDLQYGDTGDEVAKLRRDLGFEIFQDDSIDPLTDMDAFAAQVSAMDLIVSVANTTVHTAGALGRPVWALVPAVADWRWMRARDDSPWYPTARLFRQARSGDWSQPVAAAADALRKYVN